MEKYRIEKKLGEGGMGIVYKAWDTALERPVALKVMHPMFAQDEKFLKRFKAEARALARLDDPHIVSVHDLLETDTGLYIVMQYVESVSLGDKIKSDGPLRYEEACAMIKQVLTALGHAHHEQVLHRDIKPKNILLTPQGLVKVVDFGLAKIQQNSNITLSHETGGTLYYMSPEQVLGLDKVDRRSDIYSAGMTLYETLTGRMPFEKTESDFAIRKAIVEKKFPPPNHYNPLVPEALANIVAKAITKDPDKRFQTAEEMVAALEKFEREAAAAAQPREKKRAKKIPWRSLAPLAFVLILLSAAVGWWLNSELEPEKKPPRAVAPDSAIVSILVNPRETQVMIDGQVFSPAQLTNLKLLPGPHRISLVASGYSSQQTQFNVEAGINPVLRYNLEKIKIAPPSVKPVAKSSLKITSQPARASVNLNGRYVGSTPYEDNQIELGDYQVQITLSGYKEYRETVAVRSGETKRVFANLLKVVVEPPVFPSKSSLLIQSTPSGAAVLLNGREIKGQRTPCGIANLAAGTYQLVLRKDGYKIYLETVTLAAGQKRTVEAKLTALTGQLKILVQPYGTIYLDSQQQRAATDQQYVTDLTLGRHHVVVVHPQLGIWEKYVDLKQDEVIDLRVDFNQKVTLTVGSTPEWGEVYIDGKATGEQTPRKFTMRIGRHTIDVRRPGYVSGGEKTIQLEEDRKEPLIFTLKKVQ